MNNFEIAEAALETAADSAGSALAENEVYLDSIQGRLDQLTASWQVLSSDILDTDFVKGVISALTKVTDIIDGIIDQVGVLGLAFAGLGTKFLSSLEWTGSIKSTASGAGGLLQSLLGSSGLALSTEEVGVLSQINQAIADGTYKASEYSEQLSKCSAEFQTLVANSNGAKITTKQFGNTTVAAASGVKGLATSFGLALETLAPILIQMALLTAAMWALNWAIKQAKNLWVQTSKSLKASTTRLEETQETLEETTSTIEELNSELETTQERLAELQAQGSLSLSEQSELEQLKEQNALLTRQLALYNAIAEAETKAETQAAYDVLQAYTGADAINSPYTASVNENLALRSDMDIADYIDYYTEQIAAIEQQMTDLSLDDTLSDAKYQKKLAKLEQQKASYEESLTTWLERAQEGLLTIDTTYLDDEARAWIQKIQLAIDRSLYQSGALEITDLISFELSSDAADAYTDTINKLLANIAEVPVITADIVNDSFDAETLAMLEESYGITAEELAEHVNSLRETGAVLDTIFSKNPDAGWQELIDEMFADDDFEISVESLTSLLGDDFVTAIEDVGLSMSDVVTYYNQFKSAVTTTSLSDSISELSDIQTLIDDLNDAYSDFVDNGYVAASALSDLYTTFADLKDTTVLDNLVMVLSDTASTAEDVSAALNDVVESYLNQSTALGELTESNKELYKAQLENMGIANAAAIVEYKLAMATIEDADASSDAKKAAKELAVALYDDVSALDTTAAASVEATAKLELFEAAEALAAGNNFADVVSDHATALLSVAEAAGESAATLAKYAQVLAKIAAIQALNESIKVTKHSATLTLLRKQAEALAADAQAEFSSLLTSSVNYTATYSGSSSSSSSSGDTVADLYSTQKKYLDWLLEMNKITEEEYYEELWAAAKKYLKGQSDYLEEYRDALADVAQARRDAYDAAIEDLDDLLTAEKITVDEYYSQAMALAKKWLKNRVSTEEDYEEAVIAIYEQVTSAWTDSVADGSLSIEKYYEDSMALANKLLKNMTYNTAEYAEAVKAIYDEVVSYWEDLISDMETKMSHWTLTSTWDPSRTEASYWEELLDELRDQYLAGLFDDTTEYYTLRYELLEKLQDANTALWESELEYIQDAGDSIQDLIDLVSDMLKQEYEDQIDLLEDQLSAYEDIIAAKKESLSLTKEENEYQKELEEYNQSLAELQAQAAVLALDDSREGQAKYAAVLAEIAELQADIASTQSDHTYDATVDALEAAQTAYTEKIEAEVASIEEMLDEAGPWLEKVYQYIADTPPSELLSQLKNYNYYHGTGMDSDVEKIWTASEALLDSFNSNIAEILEYLASQESLLQEQIDSVSSSSTDSSASANYVSNLYKKVQASATRSNTDEENMALLDAVVAQWGDAWYDTENQVIYMGTKGDKRVTAGAYTLIENMKSIVNDSSLTSSEIDEQLAAKLATLKTLWSYSNAHIEGSGKNAHLYKYAGTSETWKIFHSGLAGGFVGSDGNVYTPITKKQNEAYALLTNDELVLNRTDQERLAVQLQALASLSDVIQGLQLDNLSLVGGYSMGDISVQINAPITVNGNSADLTKQLDKFSDSLADKTLNSVTDALKKRGFNTSAAANARSK